MTIGFRNDPNYNDDLYSFILAREESGTAKLQPYVDSVGIPTIGVGFNLMVAANRNSIYSELGTDPGLQNALRPVFDRTYAPNDTQSLVDAVAAAITNYNSINNTSFPTSFGFTSGITGDTQVRNVFNVLVQSRENRVSRFLTGVPENSFNSFERIVLVSLAWNERRTESRLLGDKLYGALKAGNRAEAWFEIRYNSNGGDSRSPGIANRRYRESDFFQLFSDPSNINENHAKQALRMGTNGARSTFHIFSIHFAERLVWRAGLPLFGARATRCKAVSI